MTDAWLAVVTEVYEPLSAAATGHMTEAEVEALFARHAGGTATAEDARALDGFLGTSSGYQVVRKESKRFPASYTQDGGTMKFDDFTYTCEEPGTVVELRLYDSPADSPAATEPLACPVTPVTLSGPGSQLVVNSIMWSA
jgi:hypothetical protein